MMQQITPIDLKAICMKCNMWDDKKESCKVTKNTKDKFTCIAYDKYLKNIDSKKMDKTKDKYSYSLNYEYNTTNRKTLSMPQVR